MKIKNDLTYWSFMIDGDTDLSPKKCEIRMLQGRLATTQLKKIKGTLYHTADLDELSIHVENLY